VWSFWHCAGWIFLEEKSTWQQWFRSTAIGKTLESTSGHSAAGA
jgi:hypothetical protein